MKYLASTSIAHFVNDGNFLLITLLIVYYKALPDVNYLVLGYGAVIVNILSGLLSTPIGRWADRTGADAPIMVFGLVIQGFAVTMFALPFLYPAAWFVLIFLAASLLGIGQAFYHPLGASILRSVYSGKGPSYLGIKGSVGSIGRAATPAIFGYLVILGDIYTAFLYLVISIFGFSLLIYLSIGSYRREGISAPGRHRTGKMPGTGSQKLGAFVILLTVSVFLRSMVISGVTIFTGKYIDALVDSPTLTSEILTLSFIPPVAGQLVFGRATSSHGGKSITLLTGILTVAFLVLFLATQSVILVVAFYSLFNLVAFTGFPVLLGYASQQVAPSMASRANAFIWGIGSTLGGAAGISILTFLSGLYSIYFSFWVAVVFGTLSIPFILLIPDKDRKKRDNSNTGSSSS